MTIGFIGLGNMAKAIIAGILKKEIVSAKDIVGSAKTAATCKAVEDAYGIATETSNKAVAEKADILFLAVKPQFFPEVIEEIKESVKPETVIISIAAGKTIAYIEEAFAKTIKLVRTMPNTPAMVGEGCTGMCCNEALTEAEKEKAKELLESFGSVVELPERLMDTFSAIAGCSPAYVFMFIEAMADAAVCGGMPRKQAIEVAEQAVLGSAKLARETGKHPAELKDMVCSPAGTTIEGVKILEENGFRGTVMDALQGCIDKSKKL